MLVPQLLWPTIGTFSVDNVRDRRRGTIGKGARQLTSLFSVDENALSSGNQTNTDSEDSASGEEDRTNKEEGPSQEKSEVGCVEWGLQFANVAIAWLHSVSYIRNDVNFS